jgi:hypothetical protein
VEWMLPPLWPWKVIMLPARGPRPQLKGETVLSLRLMDDVQLPQVAARGGPGWRSFGEPRNQSFHESDGRGASPALAIRGSVATSNTEVSAEVEIPRASYASFVSPDTSSAAALTSTGGPVFILNTGVVLLVGNYQYQNGRITYTLAHGGGGVVGMDEVDWTTTTRVNAQRGIRMTLHGGHLNSGASGL